jgi:hypothetical protein
MTMTDDEAAPMFALYSEKQRQYLGTVFWETEHGKEIECTMVAYDPTAVEFNDVEVRGRVVKYSRHGEMAPAAAFPSIKSIILAERKRQESLRPQAAPEASTPPDAA